MFRKYIKTVFVPTEIRKLDRYDCYFFYAGLIYPTHVL